VGLCERDHSDKRAFLISNSQDRWYLVSGMGTPSNLSRFTYPPEFRDELFRIVPNYELDIDLIRLYR
ncbi:MAG: hypothetical protein NZ992_03400, partial [Candidatus Korarchaeum sp.]|nr:hypothetical protein [Candidatus Korarchaeum sp.]